jgi:hypothetical protein
MGCSQEHGPVTWARPGDESCDVHGIAGKDRLASPRCCLVRRFASRLPG